MAQQAEHGARLLAPRRFLRLGFVQGAAQEQGDDGGQSPDDEGDAPAPGAQFVAAQRQLQHHDHQYGQQLPTDQRHVLEGGEEAAVPLHRHLAHVGGGGAVFAAHAQPLHHARQGQQQRRGDADGLVGRQHGDEQRAGRHHQHGQDHRAPPPVAVGDGAEDPAAQRAHEEAHGEDGGGVQQLRRRVARREEGMGEVERGEGIGVEIVPLHQIAGGGADDGQRLVAERVRVGGGRAHDGRTRRGRAGSPGQRGRPAAPYCPVAPVRRTSSSISRTSRRCAAAISAALPPAGM